MWRFQDSFASDEGWKQDLSLCYYANISEEGKATDEADVYWETRFSPSPLGLEQTCVPYTDLEQTYVSYSSAQGP